jgi:hypothetical protein
MDVFSAVIWATLAVVLVLIAVLVYYLFFASPAQPSQPGLGGGRPPLGNVGDQPCVPPGSPIKGCPSISNVLQNGDIVAAGHWNGDTSNPCWQPLNDYAQRDSNGLFYLSVAENGGVTYFYADRRQNGQCGPLIYAYQGLYPCSGGSKMKCQV